MDSIRILIADDHTLFREGVHALLSVASDTEVVGQAANGDEAIAQAAALLPDVILMDIQMPGVNGIEATRRILHSSPHIGIIVVTMLEDDDSVFAAMRAGARGYVLKGADKAEMLKTIRAVAHGEALFGPAIARRLTHFFASLDTSPRLAVPPQAFPELTDREREVLDLIAQGHSNAVIAERLTLSPKTVSNHIANIFSKLQVADRAQAIVRARGPGLAKKPDWVTVPLVELNTQTRGHLAFPRTRRADVLVRRRRALAEGRRFARVRRIDPLGAPGNSLILAVAP